MRLIEQGLGSVVGHLPAVKNFLIRAGIDYAKQLISKYNSSIVINTDGSVVMVKSLEAQCFDAEVGNRQLEVFYLPKSEPVEQERRVADIDDGYTRFANELLEAIASADLTARQLKVMLAYVRKTYGFNKKTDRIADEQIAQLTGLSRQNVNKAKKKELISMNCLFMDGNQIGVNSEVSAWQFSKCLQVSNFVSKLETKNVSN